MPRKLKLSSQQRDVLWLLEEAGSETIRTVIVALKVADLTALAASLQGLVDLGLIDLEYAGAFGLPYVGADAIAALMNVADPSAVRIAAARKYSAVIKNYIGKRRSFVCESTLSGLAMQKVVHKARDASFAIGVAAIFVDSAEVCLARIAQRVRMGGHDVPAADVRRRFNRSLRNFWTIYRKLADHWVLLYNGITAVQDVAVGSGETTSVRDPELFAMFLDLAKESR